MAKSLEKSRNFCALQGALNTVQEIKGVVPIVHSNAGCGIQQALVNNEAIVDGFSIPSTNISEKHVIFGGSSRLREEINNTVKIIEGDLYIVLSGCAPELVGDDIKAMTKEAQEQGINIIYYNAPGFKGNGYLGYEGIINNIINQLPEITTVYEDKIEKLVNIFGIIPNQNPYWKGDLEELKRILEGIGLKVNTLFGYDKSVSDWKNTPEAQLNLVFSKWGIKAAENLKSRYDIDYLNFESVPVGALETVEFINKVALKFGIDKETYSKFIENEVNKEAYYVSSLLNMYVDNSFQRTFAIVGEESYIKGISKFLKDTFSMFPKVIISTDIINNQWDDKNIDMYYSEDLNEIEEIINKSNVELILASSLENDIANKLNIPIQNISFPIKDEVILNKSYLGFSGALNLLRDLSTKLLMEERRIEEITRADIKKLIAYKGEY